MVHSTNERTSVPLTEEFHQTIFTDEFVARFVLLVEVLDGDVAENGIEKEISKPCPFVLNKVEVVVAMSSEWANRMIDYFF